MAELLERECQLDELAALLAKAASGHGYLAFIGGEAGISKSSLIETFCRAHGEARVLTGSCDALSTLRPLGPLLDMARQSGGALRRLLAPDRRESPLSAPCLTS